MTLLEVITALREVAIGAAAVVGAVVAWRGLGTWQAQLKGNTEYELARRVLRGVLAVRDAISGVRAPFMSAGEFAEAYKAAGKEITDPTNLDDGPVYQRRWEPLQKARAELHLDMLEAEALWGRAVPELEARLNERCSELFAVVQTHLRERALPRRTEPRDYAQYEKREAILYQMGSDPANDAYLASVISVVDAFEAFFRPKLTFQ